MTEINRAVLFGKLNRLLLSSLESATAFCKLRGNPYVELAHWLHQLAQHPKGDLQCIAGYFNLDLEQLSQDIITALDRLPRGATSVSDLSEHIDSAVERAWVFSSLTFANTQIRGAHLILGMLNTTNLHNQVKAISAQFALINKDLLQEKLQTIVADSSESTLLNNNVSSATDVPASSNSNESALQKYGTNLTEKARKGEIDPVAARDEEIRQLVDILMRRRQNNPLLTGEAGVGKTAVVEGLALRIAQGDIPPQLRNVALYLLDIGILQAGAGVKGEFESRLQALINEVQSSPTPIILFIDEIHTLIGAGGTQGTGDAANLMKPALARGQLRTIGATTWSEYKKYIEKDPALTRRFQVVQVYEPNEEKAILMLRHVRSALEKHHQVLLLDEAVKAAVQLSHRYIPARQLPDKAIALLDTACARVAVSQHAEPAQVEHCRRKIETLEIEFEIAQREARLGLGDSLRPAEIRQQLLDHQAQLTELNKRWQTELELVRQIIDIRAKLTENLTDDNLAKTEEIEVTTETTTEADVSEHIDIEQLQAELIDTQQQLAALQGESPLLHASVDEQIVAAVIADWTGIPLGRMVKDEVNAVLQLTDTLNKRVIGQNYGLDLISRRIRTARAKLDDPNKPIGVFLLCGPSGVGKTETAIALAETLYGGEQNLITINMSEFQEAHTVSTLKGAPPGYVGYGEGGVLTEAVRRRPYSVVLLDEIEKAHTDVHEIFFQVFDKGWMEDGEGRRIDFRNTVIILTSNAGTDVINALCVDPELIPEPEVLSKSLRESLLRVFPAALLGRLLVVPYYPLTDETLGKIIELQLKRIQQRLLDNHEITCTFDNEVIQQIIQRCTEIESGGRMVDAILLNNLLPQISHRLLSAGTLGQEYQQLHITIEDGDFAFHFTE